MRYTEVKRADQVDTTSNLQSQNDEASLSSSLQLPLMLSQKAEGLNVLYPSGHVPRSVSCPCCPGSCPAGLSLSTANS